MLSWFFRREEISFLVLLEEGERDRSFQRKKLETKGRPVLYLNQPPKYSLDVLRVPNEEGSHLANDPLD